MGNYLDAGTYSISGQGGIDIGSFSGSVNVAPELIWTNRSGLETVDRSQPLTLTWSGGGPTTLVTMEGQSVLVQGTKAISAPFQCWARKPDGRFTIPASVLSALPPNGPLVISPTVSSTQRGSLAIATVGRARGCAQAASNMEAPGSRRVWHKARCGDKGLG